MTKLKELQNMKVNELVQLVLDLETEVKELRHVIDKKGTFWNAMTKPSLIQFGYKDKKKIDNKTSEIEMYDDGMYEDGLKKQ